MGGGGGDGYEKHLYTDTKDPQPKMGGQSRDRIYAWGNDLWPRLRGVFEVLTMEENGQLRAAKGTENEIGNAIERRGGEKTMASILPPFPDSIEPRE